MNMRKRNFTVLVALSFGFLVGFFFSTGRDTYWNDGSASAVHSTISCPAQCMDDPYAKPGMVLWGKDQFGKETRYVAFPPSPPPDAAPLRTKDLDLGGKAYWSNITDALELAVPAYTQAIKHKDEELVEFARGKLALFIGSSHDRANVEQFCLAVGGETRSWGAHIAAVCQIGWLDLTLASWFFVGMVDNEAADWFVSTEQRPITFERRIPEIMVPAMEEAGLKDMKPDLVVFSSLFWDESFIWRHGMQVGHYSTDPTDGLHGFFYEELKWHRSRVRELIALIRQMYGENVPLMFRTRQHRAKNRWGGVLKIFQLDQSIKTVAREMGVRYFSWGSKLEGWLKFQDEDQHYSFGPTTYLFGDMFLFYLHQASIPGCWTCQLQLDVVPEL